MSGGGGTSNIYVPPDKHARPYVHAYRDAGADGNAYANSSTTHRHASADADGSPIYRHARANGHGNSNPHRPSNRYSSAGYLDATAYPNAAGGRYRSYGGYR